MSTTRGAEPAYPTTSPLESWGDPLRGLSKRELFAGMAMQGIIAGGYGDTTPHCDRDAPGEVAHFAVMYADALLAELERGR